MKRQTAILRDEADRKRVLSVLSAVSLEKPWVVEWEPQRKKRSRNQNSLYWRWCDIFADETGHSVEEIHDTFRQMFLPRKIVSIGGADYEVRPSTTKLSTAEMAEYMDRIYALALSQGIILPVPEDLGMSR